MLFRARTHHRHESDQQGIHQPTFGMEAGRPYADRALREATVKAINWELMVTSINGSQIPGSASHHPSARDSTTASGSFYRNLDESRKIPLDQAGDKIPTATACAKNRTAAPSKSKSPRNTQRKRRKRSAAAAISSSIRCARSASRRISMRKRFRSDEVWEAGMVDGTHDMNIGYCTLASPGTTQPSIFSSRICRPTSSKTPRGTT